MIKNKKLIVVLLVIICLCTLTSCKVKPKEFSSEGITVTLTNKFRKMSVDNVDVSYISNKVGFAGLGEAKSLLKLDDGKLYRYTEMVLDANNKSAEIYEYNDGVVIFNYAYYVASVNDIAYKYLLVTKEGTNKYYSINFWTKLDDFSEYKDQMLEWAKTIVVE